MGNGGTGMAMVRLHAIEGQGEGLADAGVDGAGIDVEPGRWATGDADVVRVWVRSTARTP